MKCKHSGCNCSGNDVKADGYCSDKCRQSSGSGKCDCGHAACKH